MARYRKKPVEVEAMQYLREENIADIQAFVGDSLKYDVEYNEYYIETLEGNMFCSRGDYIIKGVNGEFYPCKPDIFEKTYDPVYELTEEEIKNITKASIDRDKVFGY